MIFANRFSMKTTLIAILMIPFLGISQEEEEFPLPPPPVPVETTKKGEEIVSFPDVDAKFPGGAEALMKFIQDNIQYPETAKTAHIEGKVYVSYIVELDGSITNIKVERGASKELNNEAKRVVGLMPNWIPAESQGKKVRSRCILPIMFEVTR